MKNYLKFRNHIQVGTNVTLKANGDYKTGVVVCMNCIGSFCVNIENYVGIGCRNKGLPWKITWGDFGDGLISNNVNCKKIIVI